MSKQTRIISAFPGTGKSYCTMQGKFDCIDSDSSQFSWVKDADGNNTKERNPDFPDNYIQHIKEHIGKVDFIFVSTHKEVREALRRHCLFYYVVFPEARQKKYYLERYRSRGSSEEFIKLMDTNWTRWIKDCRDDREPGATRVRLIRPCFYLAGVLCNVRIPGHI